MFKLSQYQYHLPDDQIASHPLPQRSASKLLCLTDDQPIQHKNFKDIIDLIRTGDLLIFNDTKVIPARLKAFKSSGGKVEVLIERVINPHKVLAQLRVSKPPKAGDILHCEADINIKVGERKDRFYELLTNANDSFLDILEKIGTVPLPPYIKRVAACDDVTRYQTIYARHKGSVAAPTAGFHFDEALMQQLTHKGVHFAYLTLHIGAGTFLPVRTNDIRQHQMHAEYFQVSAELCQKVKETKQRGNKIIAVGTTSLRALEACSQTGELSPYQGDTSIFIYPGYQFNCVDALITNLHLPCSTLLMLVCAFGGYHKMMRAYLEAVAAGYRFYSYGDAMWVEKD